MGFIGYAFALLIGITLGLIGSGGSILTVPVLVYIMGISPVLATAYSLFVVGITSLVGVINSLEKGLVSIKTAIIFAIPAFIAVYLTRLYIVPAIPENLFSLGDFTVTRDIGIMVFFAIIMIVAAISMMKKRETNESENQAVQFEYNYPMIAIEGGVVGVLTGIVGAGGGFLIIPALVLLAKLPMKLAIGTSLFIIAIKSLTGFVGDIQSGQVIDWQFLLIFTGLSVIGIFLGGYWSNYIQGSKLKKGFAWFVLIMAFYILAKELVLQ